MHNKPVILFIDPIAPELMVHPEVPGVGTECTTVHLNILKLDETWKRDLGAYVGLGGRDIKERKLEKVRGLLDAGLPIEKPVLHSPSGNPERFEFVDGRHRVAVFRERGIEICPFVVPKHLADAFVRCFG